MVTNQDDRRSEIPNQDTPVVAHMMKPGVVQIPGDVSVTEAAALLEREQMSCLLVKDTDTRFGLMTPSDIVKKVVAQGLEPDEVLVRTIMTRPVQFIEYDRAVEEASTLMTATGTPILIVTKEDQPVGILTARDLALSPKRCLTNLQATVHLFDAERQRASHPATIVRLSHIGALIEPTVPLVPGGQVGLSFTLPDDTAPLTVRGTILKEYRQGSNAEGTPNSLVRQVDVQFTALSPADQSRILAWVLKNSPKSSDLA